MINRILQEKEIEFYIGKYQGLGMLYSFQGKDYIVTAAAYDGYGYNNLYELQKTLSVLFIVGLTLLFIVGYLLARFSLKPIRDIVQKAETITSSQMDRRLPVKNEKDELGELSITFNALLDRLETSFNSQKMFVSNVSHEMRTPLAALIAELDLSLQKERSEQQYKEAIQHALQDARRMTKLIDGLLNLAKADYQKEQIKMQEIRLDELLLDVREYILKAHPEYNIHLFHFLLHINRLTGCCDLCFSDTLILLFNLIQFIHNNLCHGITSCQNIFIAVNICHCLIMLFDERFDLQTNQLIQTHFQNGICLLLCKHKLGCHDL